MTEDKAAKTFKPGDRVRSRWSLNICVVQEVIPEDHPAGDWIICDKAGGRASMLVPADEPLLPSRKPF